MLSRIPVHRFDALRPIISRYLAPTCRSRRRLLSDSPAAAAAATEGRRWVMLSSAGRRCPNDTPFVADANTVAESRTSKGRHVRVSLRCAAPPSSSYLYYDFPESSNDPYYDDKDSIRIVAANRELVLLKMSNPRSCSAEDYFLYRPSGGACRPPSLSLLPDLEFPTKPESVPASYFDPPNSPWLDNGRIGLLRRGENDVLVVHVDMWYDRDAKREKAVFSVLRPGMLRWELMEPVPVFQYSLGSPQKVICIGDRFLCCICYSRGFLLCDMADEASPKVRYVDLPLEVRRCGYDDSSVRVQCLGAAGDSSLRLVSIHPNCCRSVDPDRDLYSNDHHYYQDCCCRDGRTECWHPRFVFTIKTWTMNLNMDEEINGQMDEEWVEDREVHGEEIWGLPGYKGLPQAIPEWPVMCLDKPNVVCFLVSNYHFTKDIEKEWMVQVNITTKTLLSVVQLTSKDECWRDIYNYHLPAEFQY